MKLNPRWFAAYRILLGVYLAALYFSFVPWGEELLGPTGMVPVSRSNPMWVPFPGALHLVDSAGFAPLFLTLLAAAALLFAAGVWRRGAAVALWYGQACIIQRNAFMDNPAVAFVGWVLLATLLVPPGEPWSAVNRSGETAADWDPPDNLMLGAWIVFGAAYSVSGIMKLASPEWWNGDAFRNFLDLPLHREWFVHSLLRDLPGPVLTALGWLAAATETAFLPAILWRYSRPTVWTLTVGMHLIVLLTVDCTLLTLGAIVSLLFLFDPEWIAMIRWRVTRQD